MDSRIKKEVVPRTGKLVQLIPDSPLSLALWLIARAIARELLANSDNHESNSDIIEKQLRTDIAD